MSELFREEAVRHATRRLSGEVILATSLPSLILTALAVVTVAGGLVFAATATYARKETVIGWVAPKAGLIRLAARQGGVVSDLGVQEGQMVSAGQTVATLALSSEVEGGDSLVAFSRSLDAQATATEAGASARLAALSAEQVQLRARSTALAREREETRRALRLQEERLTLARAEVERAQAIADQGFLPRRELEARRSAELWAQQEASTLSGRILSFDREIGEVVARLSAIPIDAAAVRASAASAQAGLNQQRTQTEVQGRYAVVSTVAGRVAATPVEVGQTLAPGATVAVVTAGNSRLEAELFAPSRAAGFIRVGQPVRLMYQAFPFQKFGAGKGQVTAVSRTVLAPSEVAIPGLQFQEPVFRVKVRLERESVAAYGAEVPLQPGMLLNADIVVDRRSLLEWLLDPLYAAGRRK